MERWNRVYFDGELSPECLELLKGLDGEHPDVRAVVERMMQAMSETRFGARDFSTYLAWEVGRVLPKTHPGAWGDMVPPITGKGRHERLDEYVASNPWHPLAAGETFLDVGCGFPPVTTVNTAERFPDCRVIGIDPSFGRFLLRDEQGDYAVFSDRETLRYFQAGSLEIARWEALNADPQATRARFLALFARLRPALVEGRDDELCSVERDGARLTVNPIHHYARPNLELVEGDLENLALPAAADVARCFNVLVYLDRPSRAALRARVEDLVRDGGLFITGMDHAWTTFARYLVEQKTGGRLRPREFAFSVENVRPLVLVPWLRFHDDDECARRLILCLKRLRADRGFLESFDATMDELCAQTGIAPRRSDGSLGGIDPAMSQADREQRFQALRSELDRRGFVDAAVESLGRAGIRAWRNCVGHIGVDPACLGESGREAPLHE